MLEKSLKSGQWIIYAYTIFPLVVYMCICVCVCVEESKWLRTRSNMVAKKNENNYKWITNVQNILFELFSGYATRKHLQQEQQKQQKQQQQHQWQNGSGSSINSTSKIEKKITHSSCLHVLCQFQAKESCEYQRKKMNTHNKKYTDKHTYSNVYIK